MVEKYSFIYKVTTKIYKVSNNYATRNTLVAIFFY